MIRLIEHQPAWELHAFLHFAGLSYKCEYSPTPKALGSVLPILIIDNTIYSGEASFDIIKIISKDKSHNHLEELVSSYLYKKVCTLFGQFEKLTGTDKKDVWQSTTWGYNVYLTMLLGIKNNLELVGPYPGESIDQLVERFKSIYSELNQKLIQTERSSICSHWTKNIQVEHYGLADAMLFAHIARASYHPQLALIVKTYPHLMKYFYDICDIYFGRSVASFADFTWQVSLYHLLQNPYLAKDEADWVKESLTANLQNFNAQEIFELNHSHDTITSLHLPVLACCNPHSQQPPPIEDEKKVVVVSNFGVLFVGIVAVSALSFVAESIFFLRK